MYFVHNKLIALVQYISDVTQKNLRRCRDKTLDNMSQQINDEVILLLPILLHSWIELSNLIKDAFGSVNSV